MGVQTKGRLCKNGESGGVNKNVGEYNKLRRLYACLSAMTVNKYTVIRPRQLKTMYYAFEFSQYEAMECNGPNVTTDYSTDLRKLTA